MLDCSLIIKFSKSNQKACRISAFQRDVLILVNEVTFCNDL